MWTAEQRERYKDDGRRYPSDLTDAEWARIAAVFSIYATLTADLREMVNACFYLEKTGCGWRYLPTMIKNWWQSGWGGGGSAANEVGKAGDGVGGDAETIAEVGPERDGVLLAGLFQREKAVPASSAVLATGAAADFS